MQPSGKVGKKIYVFCSGHVTKIATRPIYGRAMNALEWEKSEKVHFSVGIVLSDVEMQLQLQSL